MKYHEYTREEIESFHRALYRGCGLDVISMGMGDQNAWGGFLFVVRDLEHDTDGGRFTLQDLVNVLADMNKANGERERKFRRVLKPTMILRNADELRDEVLLSRAKRRERPRPAKVMEARRSGDITHAVETDPAADRDAEPLSNELADFLNSSRLGQ